MAPSGKRACQRLPASSFQRLWAVRVVTRSPKASATKANPGAKWNILLPARRSSALRPVTGLLSDASSARRLARLATGGARTRG